MVVAPQPEAVEAGAEALRAGGNAVDAAVACALVQGVVDPMMTGIAGFGSLHLYLPGRGVHTFIDFHGRAPAATRPDMWAHLMEGETRDGFGFVLKGRVNDVGYQSITVPGSLRAYWEAQTEFGRLGWKDVVQPAIGYAEAGFAVRPHLHQFWTQREQFGRADNVERLRHTPAGRRIFFGPDGELHALGSRMKNPDLGRTLRRIAEGGADVFYTGDMAREIAADMAGHGGLLTLSDLATYRTTRNAPLWGEYRGHRTPPTGLRGRRHAAGDAQYSGVLRPACPRPQ
jgi:gamma-glutamyltranspeptidase/glutathione hydrolase